MIKFWLKVFGPVCMMPLLSFLPNTLVASSSRMTVAARYSFPLIKSLSLVSPRLFLAEKLAYVPIPTSRTTTTTTTRFSARDEYRCYHPQGSTHLFSTISDSSSSHRALALEAFTSLAKSGRSWRRLGHLVDLAMEDYGQNVRTIADVGTDHGLLAMALALSGRFDKVVGADVSKQALQDGALTLLANVQNYDDTASEQDAPLHIPVEFFWSNGLAQIDQADAVCIAGMGVNTMLKILTSSQSHDSVEGIAEESILHLDRIGCQQLLLQPTNSRPRNLIRLYDVLQQSGWCLADERIEYLSSRWYISSCFVRSPTNTILNGDGIELPASKLALLDASDPMRKILSRYLHHHVKWIKQEAQLSRVSNEADEKWLDQFRNQL